MINAVRSMGPGDQLTADVPDNLKGTVDGLVIVLIRVSPSRFTVCRVVYTMTSEMPTQCFGAGVSALKVTSHIACAKIGSAAIRTPSWGGTIAYGVVLEERRRGTGGVVNSQRYGRSDSCEHAECSDSERLGEQHVERLGGVEWARLGKWTRTDDATVHDEFIDCRHGARILPDSNLLRLRRNAAI